MFDQDCTLLVMSCDKYESAWYPYFVLLDKYWPAHPSKIFLCAEKKQYSHANLNIQCTYFDNDVTWSMRLLEVLKKISTKYIIFSLEDFFLQATVNHERVLNCYNYMESHPEVAVCRLKDSTNPEQVLSEKIFDNFYLADSKVDFRLETQMAIWNKEILMSFIDVSEDPWQFETYGTKRIKDTSYLFLWFKSGNIEGDFSDTIVPYTVGSETGYGITWGKWLWKNKKLFKKNDIIVDFNELGILTPLKICYHNLVNKAVYQKAPNLHYRIFSLLYRLVNKAYRIHNEWKRR